jgi:hypothetical protein
VDPDEGPVQAFACELRALREAAGNPTYRALAKTAGYSATTLGDAAGGAHLPTLEVALAYVGACGGEVERWRARWQEVAREKDEKDAGGDTGDAEVSDGADGSGVVIAQSAEPEAVPESAPEPEPAHESEPEVVPLAPHGRRIKTSALWVGVVAALVAVPVAALTGAFAAQQPGAAAIAAPPSATASRSGAPASAHCPAMPAPGSAVSFTGMTYGIGANVRTGASLQSPVRARIPAGCGVGFSGYCLGDVVTDETAGTPDMRWFIIPGEGVVASGIVHGDPPAGMRPQPCPQDVPGPAAISLGVASTGTGGGVVELAATGSRLWIVGFAAYYAVSGGGPARWHQFGFGDAQTGGTFDSAPLRLDAAAGRAGVPVVAVACVGGNGPTSVLAAATVSAGAPQTLLPAPAQSAAVRAAAEQAACQYPGAPAGS